MEGTVASFVGMPRYNESDDRCESPWRCTKEQCDGRRVPHRSRQGWEVCIETHSKEIGGQSES